MLKALGCILLLSIGVKLSSATDWFPIEQSKGHILIPIKIDGQHFKAIVDTGANRSVMDSSLANYLEVQSEETIKIRGSNTSKTVFLSSAIDALINDRQLTLPAMAIVNLYKVNRDADMIIGLDVLEKYRFELDFVNARMRFIDQSFDNKRYERLPIIKQQRVYTLAVTAHNNTTLNLLLDTGNASYTGINESKLGSVQAASYKQKVHMRGLFSVKEYQVVKIPLLNIGTHQIKDIQATVAKKASQLSDFDGNIGTDVLKHFSVIFDLADSSLYFQSPKPQI